MKGGTAHFVVYGDGSVIDARAFVRNVRFISTLNGETLDQYEALLTVCHGGLGSQAPSDDAFGKSTTSRINETVDHNRLAVIEPRFGRPLRLGSCGACCFILLLILFKGGGGNYLCSLNTFKTRCTQFASISAGPLEASVESSIGTYDYSLKLDTKISAGSVVQIQVGRSEPIYAFIVDNSEAAVIKTSNSVLVEIPLIRDKSIARSLRNWQRADLVSSDDLTLRLRRINKPITYVTGKLLIIECRSSIAGKRFQNVECTLKPEFNVAFGALSLKAGVKYELPAAANIKIDRFVHGLNAKVN